MKDYSHQEIRQLLRFWIDGEAEIEPERLRYFVSRLLEDEASQAAGSATHATGAGSAGSETTGGPRVGLDDLVDQLSNPDLLQKVVFRSFKKAWGQPSWNDTSHN